MIKATDLTVVAVSPMREEEAKSFAQRHGLAFSLSTESQGSTLSFTRTGVVLCSMTGKKPLELKISFTEGAVDHRRKFGGGKGQLISKAVGLSKGFVPHILDTTAGLGRDAFVLASLGAKVDMFERSPIVHVMLNDALEQGRVFAEEQSDEGLVEILNRMSLQCADSLGTLGHQDEAFDIVYLDPMFPERKKSAAVKKDMQIFHEIVGRDDDADALLALALETAKYRVVVKRPRVAPDLADEKPSYRLEGKSSRFDIYTKKALPV